MDPSRPFFAVAKAICIRQSRIALQLAHVYLPGRNHLIGRGAARISNNLPTSNQPLGEAGASMFTVYSHLI